MKGAGTMIARKTNRSKKISLVVGLLGSILALAPTAGAQSTASASPVQVNVAGHVELPGMRVRQIFLQQRGDKSYLFLRRADKNAFAVVDVTNPSKPVLVERHALEEPAGASVDLPAQGSALAIALIPTSASGSGASVTPAAASVLPTETVRLLDTSDPRHPKTIKTFEGVTSIATDDGRKLVFLVNNDGLWVVSHHRNRPLPKCTTEDEEKAEPSCE
jgi:LVIVD repeat